MLSWRLLLGAAFIAGLTALCWADYHAQTPGIWLFPLALALSALASSEMLWLFSSRNLRPQAAPIYVGNALIVSANWASAWTSGGAELGAFGWPLIALALSMLWLFVGEMRRYTAPGAVTEQLAAGSLALVYVGVLLSFVVQLRLFGGGAWGMPALLSLVVVVKMCDTGAYTVGRLFGRHKMSPLLSPGKTIEGLLGGLAFACFGAWVCFQWLFPQLAGGASRPSSDWGWLAFGLLVGLAGVIGDLAESLLKRDLGQKNSSSWMPGFGGVLDVLDSILLAAPVAYLCWTLQLV